MDCSNYDWITQLLPHTPDNLKIQTIASSIGNMPFIGSGIPLKIIHDINQVLILGIGIKIFKLIWRI